MNIKRLMIPIYGLYHIENINDFSGLTEDNLEGLRRGYNKSKLDEIIEAVRWATQHPEYDFKSLISDVPYENEEIYEYLCKWEKNLHRL